MTALCHLVGLDEIHKNNLLKILPSSIKIVDLDAIQTQIQKNKEIIGQKAHWSKISNKIIQLRKSLKIIGSKNNTQIIKQQIKNKTLQRNKIKLKIHKFWKKLMIDSIKISTNTKNDYIFVGFNIYPKDYRVKVDLSLNIQTTINNRILFDISATLYAANQIKYYLHAYSDKIINGEFPLNLLKTEYLSEKYDKFINYYSKKNYILKKKNEIINYIQQIQTNLTTNNTIISPLLIKNKTKVVQANKLDLSNNAASDGYSSSFLNKKETGENLESPILGLVKKNNTIIQSIIDCTKTTTLKNKCLTKKNQQKCENQKEIKSDKINDNQKLNNGPIVVYVPTVFKTGKTIPVNKNTPIQGYYNKKDAIDAVRNRIKNNRPIYLHKTTLSHFYVENGKLLSKNPIETFSEESLLLSSQTNLS